MDIMITRIKDTEEFKLLKSQAWEFINGNGSFDIDDFSPPAYKYFDKLLQLYGRMLDGKITKQQAAEEDEKNYEEYEKFVDERFCYIQDHKEFEHNRSLAHDELTRCEKAQSIEEMFDALAQAASRFTGDEGFAQRQRNKLQKGDKRAV